MLFSLPEKSRSICYTFAWAVAQPLMIKSSLIWHISCILGWSQISWNISDLDLFWNNILQSNRSYSSLLIWYHLHNTLDIFIMLQFVPFGTLQTLRDLGLSLYHIYFCRGAMWACSFILCGITSDAGIMENHYTSLFRYQWDHW